MLFEDEPTQRIWHTSVGLVDYERAAAALKHISARRAAPDQFRVLAALCTSAFRHERVVLTDRGSFTGVGAAQLLNRMRDKLTTDDIDACWSLLAVLFATR